jgi:ABC-type uncharacterized transport system substrate-binding protein
VLEQPSHPKIELCQSLFQDSLKLESHLEEEAALKAKEKEAQALLEKEAEVIRQSRTSVDGVSALIATTACSDAVAANTTAPTLLHTNLQSSAVRSLLKGSHLRKHSMGISTATNNQSGTKQ